MTIDPHGVPTVRGTCFIPEVTTDEVAATLQLPGMRFLWDSRFDGGRMLRRFEPKNGERVGSAISEFFRRYNFHTFTFTTAMKGQGWLVWPRTIVGGRFEFCPGS